MDELTHVYCMPGMGATSLIFEHINLPEKEYEMHWLSWIKPHKKEPIEAYAQRLAENIHHDHVVLIGVSLGGVIVQEMQKFIKVKRIILISTIKTWHELPASMKWAQKTRFYKILPTGLAKHYKKLKKLPLGKRLKKHLEVYERYIGVYDKAYLKWAIAELLNWERKIPFSEVVHIHGDKDHVFPIKNIKDCFVVPKGTHIMIVNRFRWFNENLPDLIASGVLSKGKNA